MQVGTFYQELNARRGGCCKDGKHSLQRTEEVIAEYNATQKRGSGRIYFGRVMVFFRALRIECDCQVLARFNPFQDLMCVQNWNLAILPSSSSPVGSEGKGFFYLLQSRRAKFGELKIEPVLTLERGDY